MAIRNLLTNFSKGELSPLVEGRPDLAAYFEGGSTIENWNLLRQGGVTRRPGSRFIAETKFGIDQDTVLIPFVASVDDSFICEFGHLYIRFYKNKAPIMSGPVPYEIVSPYTSAQLRLIHFTQSVDVLFADNPDVAPQRLTRVTDTNWAIVPDTANPPPSFEKDTDLSGGSITLTPGATSGSNVNFHASAAVFLLGDVGRQIVFGASRAIITALGSSAGDAGQPNDDVRATIIDPFPNTSPIAAGSWLIRLSPQATLDPDIKQPIGGLVTLVTVVQAFRAEDLGKFITIYGGVVKITEVTSSSQVKGEIMSLLSGATLDNPPAASIGTWQLEVSSWSVANGYPRTPEFFQGRLAHASTRAQPTTWWASRSDDYGNYAVGVAADDAIDYTDATRELNRIEWIAENIDMFQGTSGAELRIKGGRDDEPLGGDKIPLVSTFGNNGSAPIQPKVADKRVLFVDRSRKKVFAIAFSLEEDGYIAVEVTGPSEHIMGSGVALGPIAFQKRPDPRLYFITTGGTMVTLTYFPREKVIGFTRYVTTGLYRSVASIPDPALAPDQVWVTVERFIGGQSRVCVEMLEPSAEELVGITNREWHDLQLDCAKVQNFGGFPTSTLTGLTRFAGDTVHLVIDSVYKGVAVVSPTGTIALTERVHYTAEVGIMYDSTLVTMRPAIQGQMVEGLPRSWSKIFLRLYKAYGGKVNGNDIIYPPNTSGDTIELRTGDFDVTQDDGFDTVGKVTIKQTVPYPMTVLAMFGEIKFGEHG